MVIILFHNGSAVRNYTGVLHGLHPHAKLTQHFSKKIKIVLRICSKCSHVRYDFQLGVCSDSQLGVCSDSQLGDRSDSQLGRAKNLVFCRFFCCPNGSAENIFEYFLAVRTDLLESFLKVFSLSKRTCRKHFWRFLWTLNILSFWFLLMAVQ